MECHTSAQPTHHSLVRHTRAAERRPNAKPNQTKPNGTEPIREGGVRWRHKNQRKNAATVRRGGRPSCPPTNHNRRNKPNRCIFYLVEIVVVERALGLAARAGHHGDGVDRVVPVGSLAREHHAVRAVEDGVGHVRALRAGGSVSEKRRERCSSIAVTRYSISSEIWGGEVNREQVLQQL